ncbi:AF4/FMR2 family member 1 [Scleropages formosus]|uniref:ALF transcription elongation factor 1 n=1 Tax=Scleropages formosus TaxID=113540 RepID=A0A8C9V925_SCLFO|nr:AF4/FMR2 family member 1-like [Scleropages formosus]
MASRSSLYNEDRNLQRIRERERRNQEVHQEKDLYLENVPLFGEPYKTNKGDELSSRIQRMLGNYEDVRELLGCNAPQSLADAPKSLQTQGSYNAPGHTDKTTPPYQPPPPRLPRSDLPCDSSSKPQKKLSGPEQGQLISNSSSLDLEPRSPGTQWSRGKAWLEPGECVSLPPVLSPPADPLSPLHSSSPSDTEAQDVEDKESPSSHGPSPGPCRYSSPEAQKDAPSQVETAVLPSQTFPPPLVSKSSQVMLQKPTAYVRPMDGQDQVPVESPELKPSPEDYHRQSYENLPHLKSNQKPTFSELNIPPHSVEASNDAQCVEDILREMTHTWPPLLTAIHTPNKTEPPKFSFHPKESQHIHPGISGQKSYGSSSKVLPANCHPGSSMAQGSVASTHSSGVESGSSSDSENTSESESDSDSSESDGEEASLPQKSNPPAPVTDASVANKWQLDNWLVKVNQQNSNMENMEDMVQSPSPAVQSQPLRERGKEDYTNDYKSHNPSLQCDVSSSDVKLVDEGSVCPPVCQKSPSRADNTNQREKVGNKHPSKVIKLPTTTQAGLVVETVELPLHDKDRTMTETLHLKTKDLCEKAESKGGAKKPTKHVSSKKKLKESSPKETLSLQCKREQDMGRLPSTVQARQPSPLVQKSSVALERPSQKGPKKARCQSPTSESRRAPQQKDSLKPPHSLVVKIDLTLLSRIPHARAGTTSTVEPLIADMPGRKKQKKKKESCEAPSSISKKRSAEKDENSRLMKKLKLDKANKPSPFNHGSSCNAKVPKSAHWEKDKKKAKKGVPLSTVPPPSEPLAPRVPQEEPGHKRQGSGDHSDSQPPAKHKKRQAKCTQQPETSKVGSSSLDRNAAHGGFTFPGSARPPKAPQPHRPLLKFEDRQYPVEYHMKEAKKLKHKADATVDKIGKAFNYLDAAMSFIESGIAMEVDPQTPKSAYTMFSETVDLIRFIMKLKSSLEATGPAVEKDFTVLCMRCQALLQMAMFRLKREAALKYSKTLSEHFKNSSKSSLTPTPCVSKSTGASSSMSPAPPLPGMSSGLGSNPSSGTGSSATVAIPQVIQQVAASYVNITALFLSAHDTWEQSEALTHKGSGLLLDLDSALGPLSLTSSMTLLVRHIRQALYWLRLDTT